MRNYSIFISIYLCLILSSCALWKKNPLPDSIPDVTKPSASIAGTNEAVESTHLSIKNASDMISKSVDGIKDANRDIASGVKGIKSKNVDGKLNSEVGEIEKGLAKTISNLKELEAAGEELTNAERQILKLSALLLKAQADAKTFEEQSAKKDVLIKEHVKIIDGKDKEITKLKDEKATALQHKLYYMVIAGVVSLALAGWMFVQGNSKAIGLGAFGAVLIVGSLAVSFFMKGMGAIGFVVIVIVFVMIAWKAYCDWKERQKRKKNERANKELVKTVEHLKGGIDSEKKESLFGGRVDDGEVGRLQSEETKELIREHRKVLKQEFDPIT